MNHDSSPVPSAGRHLLVLGGAYLLAVPVYLLDYGPPWRPPPPPPTGSNWIALHDLTGIYFFAAMVFVSIFAVVSSLAWVRGRRLRRPMSFATYLFSLSITVALAGAWWALALID